MVKYKVEYSDGKKEILEGKNFHEIYQITKKRALELKLSVSYEKI